MIELKNVTKVYGNDVKAVDDLSLTINDGEIFGFLGPNGAGKTTTLKMITGISSITNGTISINGNDIVKNGFEAKKCFGFVPDNPDVLVRLKGYEYLHFIAKVYGVDSATEKAKVKELADTFEMTDSLTDYIENYSHGMRQKLIMIGVLLHNPSNWILDEPLTGLDPKSAFTLKEMMRSHANANNAVLFSTHVLEVAEKLCDRVAIIKKGKLVFVGTLKELKEKHRKDKDLESIFLEMTEND